MQVRRDDIDALIQHANELLAAIDVFAELHELAGDPPLGDDAGGVLEFLAQLGVFLFQRADLLVAAIELLREGGALLGKDRDFLFRFTLAGKERFDAIDEGHVFCSGRGDGGAAFAEQHQPSVEAFGHQPRIGFGV